MNQEDRVGFFYQYFIACFQPSSYGKLLDGKRRLVPYLLFLVMVLVIIGHAIPLLAWDASVGGLKKLFTERIPEFRVEEGVLSCEKPMEFQIGNTIHFRVDAGVESFEQGDLSSDYVQEVLISQTSILVKNGMAVQSVALADLGDGVYDNQTLVNAIPLFRFSMVLYLLMAYVETAIEYLITSFFYLLIGKTIVRGADGKSVTWSQGFQIAIYARTLMAVFTSINLVLGQLIGETVMYMLSAGVSLYYMMKAERAVLGVDTGAGGRS